MQQKPILLIKDTFYNEKDTLNKLCKFIKSSRRLSMYEKCLEFEKKFAKWQGSKYCTSFSNGSTANMALIQSLMNLGKVNKGDLVAFSAVTWATNVMPLIQLGLKVCPVDVEINTLNCSSKTFLETLKKNPKIKMFFITNVLGFCSDIDEIARICKKRNIVLIEDNCESLGTIYKGKKLGNYGLAGTFSFYVGHHMSTIEGGAFVTNDEELEVMMKIVRSHGLDRNLSKKHQDLIRKKYKLDNFDSKYIFYNLGYNFRPTEITGFLGINQLNYIDKIVKKREANFMSFNKAVDTQNVYPIKYDHLDLVSNFAFPMVCKSKSIQQKLIRAFDSNLIEIRPIVSGNMMNQIFIKKYVQKKHLLPNAEIIHNQGFYFGNNPDLSKSEIKILTDTIRTKIS